MPEVTFLNAVNYANPHYAGRRIHLLIPLSCFQILSPASCFKHRQEINQIELWEDTVEAAYYDHFGTRVF
jgi:hypothetical protein